MALLRTPLYDRHRELGARIVEFAGFEMPVQYAGIQAEHRAVRESAGLFDVSHMGEFEIYGADAVDALNRVITNDLRTIEDGQACYTVMCQPDGGIVDDLVIYRFNERHLLVCCNASNRQKDFAWIETHLDDAQAEDRSDAYALLALQGPKAAAILQPLTSIDLAKLGRFRFTNAEIAGIPGVLSRTGYTGEDGFELFIPTGRATSLWDALVAQGGRALSPVGLGARDTLRLEMKYTLYGNDIDETTTPLEAGLGWVVKLDKPDFVGKEALVKQRAAGVPRRLVGFQMEGKAIARHDYPVVTEGGEVIGKVTSGTQSPSLGTNIGMAYVPAGQHEPGTRIFVRIRDRIEPARVVKTPFLKR